jgi:hypothetical protein
VVIVEKPEKTGGEAGVFWAVRTSVMSGSERSEDVSPRWSRSAVHESYQRQGAKDGGAKGDVLK